MRTELIYHSVGEIIPQIFSTRNKVAIASLEINRGGNVYRCWRLTRGHYILVADEGARQLFLEETDNGMKISSKKLVYVPRWLSDATGLPVGNYHDELPLNAGVLLDGDDFYEQELEPDGEEVLT